MSDCSSVVEHLVDFLDGSLEPGERARVEAHLASCAACAETVRAYRSILAAYDDVPEADVDAALAARILAAAREPERAERAVSRDAVAPAGRRWRLPPLLAGAAAAVLLGLAVLSLVRGGPSSAELVERGDAHRLAGEPELALEAYAEALAAADAGDEEARALFRRGALRLALGDPEGALADLTAVVEDHPGERDRREALWLQGRALEALGDPDEATRAYARLARDYPDEADAARQRMVELAQREPEPGPEAQLQGLGYVGGED